MSHHSWLLQGIQVCLISPGAVRTPIWSKSGADAAALLAAAPVEADTLYGALIQQVRSYTPEMGQRMAVIGRESRAALLELRNAAPAQADTLCKRLTCPRAAGKPVPEVM